MFCFRRDLTIALAFCMVFLSLPTFEASARDLVSTADWKDISILPTNGDAGTNIKISLTVDKTRVRPGERIVLTFHADRECYVTIMDAGTSGRIIRLWPNRYSGMNNRIPANTRMSFPSARDRFAYEIGGPNGVERIIAYATSEPGKILSEQEFKALGKTGFTQYKGGLKDLESRVRKCTGEFSQRIHWGTAQLNIPVGPAIPTRVPETLTGTTYMLAVGVPTGNLKYCKRDAQAFADTLIRKVGVKRANVRLILGSAATYDGMASGLRWLAKSTQPEDAAVIFFSGHGTSIPDEAPLDEDDGRDECFVLHYTRRPANNREALKRKILMKDDDFNKFVKLIPARKKLIVVDACHSGTINKWKGLESGDLVSKFLPLKSALTGETMWMLKQDAQSVSYGNDHEALISACLDNQAAYENRKLKGGVFITHFIRAINGGARNMEEAFFKARTAVIETSTEAQRQSRGKSKIQTPSLTDPHRIARHFTFSDSREPGQKELDR